MTDAHNAALGAIPLQQPGVMPGGASPLAYQSRAQDVTGRLEETRQFYAPHEPRLGGRPLVRVPPRDGQPGDFPYRIGGGFRLVDFALWQLDERAATGEEIWWASVQAREHGIPEETVAERRREFVRWMVIPKDQSRPPPWYHEPPDDFWWRLRAVVPWHWHGPAMRMSIAMTEIQHAPNFVYEAF